MKGKEKYKKNQEKISGLERQEKTCQAEIK